MATAPGLRGLPFTLVLIAIAAVIFAIGRWYNNSYAFFMAYVVAQYIVLGTAWNILGGYTGYVNFGVTAFFAIGAYSTVVLHKLVPGAAAAGDDRGRRRRWRAWSGSAPAISRSGCAACSSPSPRWRWPWWCRP